MTDKITLDPLAVQAAIAAYQEDESDFALQHAIETYFVTAQVRGLVHNLPVIPGGVPGYEPLAQAYSGAGGECGNSALEAAALRGTPLELEQALDKGVQDIEKVVDQWSGDIARLYPDTSRVWLNREVRRSGREAKRQTFARWWSGC